MVRKDSWRGYRNHELSKRSKNRSYFSKIKIIDSSEDIHKNISMKDKKAKLIYGDRGKEMVELSKGVGFIKRGDINACPG